MNPRDGKVIVLHTPHLSLGLVYEVQTYASLTKCRFSRCTVRAVR